jgi:glyoxylase-like metal-dependent hydrolase (beta-lactamase superfamily II)
MAEIFQRGPWTIASFVLGPAMTNAYLVGEDDWSSAVVIDPAWDGEVIVEEAERRGWRITNIWLSHAHFDHFGGAATVADASDSPIPVSLHPADHPLWRAMGGAAFFGFGAFDPGPEPTIDLEHSMKLHLGSGQLEVRHTPGHCPGHVIFSAPEQQLVFCGDLIFQGGVGRTDLPGGDWHTLLQSIQQEILVLPDDTLLLSGHGPATTVGQERRTNPFLGALR